MSNPQDNSIKTRFAPSPTGHLHLGNVRTALYSALFAWQQHGQLLLRFEDTDSERSKKAYADSIMQDLQWLGLDWDEGPGKGKDTYYQAQRTDIYENYYAQLQDQGRAYPCFCSPEKLSLVRKSQIAAGQPPRYAGTCARLNHNEVQEKLNQGLRPTLRFKIEVGEDICFDDLLKGTQRFRRKDIGDFIIRRADGSTAFFFSNAVDDSLMGVTHVVRGEDHITNTPRQIMILEALGLRIPSYAHTPMLLGDDGNLLSKRHGSFSVKEMHEQGYLPQAVTNYLGRIGQAVDNDSCLSACELAPHFYLKKMSKSSARFDSSQLKYWQKQAILSLSPSEALEWGNLQNHVPAKQSEAFLTAVLPNISFPNELQHWADVLFRPLQNATEEAQDILNSTPADFFQTAQQCLENVGENIQTFTNTLKEASGKKGKHLFMPLRAALTGRLDGPSIPEILSLLGRDVASERLKNTEKLTAQ